MRKRNKLLILAAVAAVLAGLVALWKKYREN
jgi:hypothetical protein